jgi:hypothetical protein
VDAGQAMLLCSRNLGVLSALGHISTKDLINFFGAFVQHAHRGWSHQLHVIISVKGHGHHYRQLQSTAEQWLKGMGYQRQPYLIFLHRDTANMHLHLVTTSVRLKNIKISNVFSFIRGSEVLNQISGLNIRQQFLNELMVLMEYRMESLDEFRKIIDHKGYKNFRSRDLLIIRKYGQNIFKLDYPQLEERFKTLLPDFQIQNVLIDKIECFLREYDSKPRPIYLKQAGNWKQEISGYRSQFSDRLLSEAGIEVCYHTKKGNIFSYSIIDHTRKKILAGDRLIPLERLLDSSKQSRAFLPPGKTR